MNFPQAYPKRLIEVDLPIKRISAHARREKSIRHGHISTLHIWWARRPLAACRAVICAALWPDPADPQCPQAFIKKAREQMLAWAPHERQKLLSEESQKRFEKARKNSGFFDDAEELRGALLDFIADFANWDNSTVREYLATSRALTQTAHEALGGAPGTRPLVIDPFAGGGAIPLEALRLGADAFASDLNPVAVLLNKAAQEYIPRHGQRLADEIRRWGEWVGREAEKVIASLYPEEDGVAVIAYLWARTIRCEGPGCGAELPLLRSLWLSKKKGRPTALKIVPDKKRCRIEVEVVTGVRDSEVGQPTVRLGAATCPICGYSTKITNVRAQLRERRGGTRDARLVCVVTTRAGVSGRYYRLPNKTDLDAVAQSTNALKALLETEGASAVPNEAIPQLRIWKNNPIRVHLYGMVTWGDLFTARQAFSLATFARLIRAIPQQSGKAQSPELITAVQSCLALSLSRLVDRTCSLCTWRPQADQEKVEHVFSRQALSMTWDFAEGNPSSAGTASWGDAYEPPAQLIESLSGILDHEGSAVHADAAKHPLPDDCASAMITDPPYYDAVPYSDLSDFFYVWLRRSLPQLSGVSFDAPSTPKDAECVLDEGRNKDRAFFEATMAKAMGEGQRIVGPDGVGVVVFAHKSTSGWEAVLEATLKAGWIITASWPIDTEMGTRLRALNSATLSSSVHLVCRPREDADGSIRSDSVGDWRDVLLELPRRIHEWMPRLAEEGVVGADAIFACLGPALEIFSRYSRVEKASGENVSLKEYLEQVWAAVAKEALAMIFSGADATGFEEDARLTAMWLWTLSTGASNGNGASTAEDEEPAQDEDDGATPKSKVGGFVLEYDAARKIAQGLGAHLEQLASLIQVKGSTARLLPVAERTRSLFQKGESAAPIGRAKTKKKSTQLSLGFVADLEEAEETGGWGETGAPHRGETVLDRVHQSMILFGAGRGEALKRFLVDDGVGRDERFWRLAQAFSALYPSSTDEKRWVDGVLARKRGLGF